jgi:hypothetical protein
MQGKMSAASPTLEGRKPRSAVMAHLRSAMRSLPSPPSSNSRKACRAQRTAELSPGGCCESGTHHGTHLSPPSKLHRRRFSPLGGTAGSSKTVGVGEGDFERSDLRRKAIVINQALARRLQGRLTSVRLSTGAGDDSPPMGDKSPPRNLGEPESALWQIFSTSMQKKPQYTKLNGCIIIQAHKGRQWKLPCRAPFAP